MTDQPESVTPSHRLSLNVKLGVVFMLLALIAAGSLYLFNTLRDSTLNIADIINQSGRLRYLSQEVALHSSGFVPEQSEDARQSVRDAQGRFEANYTKLSREIAQLPGLMRSAGDNLEERLEQIEKTWQHQHAALEQVLAKPDLAKRRAAQREVAASAMVMLSEADHLVGALEKSRAHRQPAGGFHHLPDAGAGNPADDLVLFLHAFADHRADPQAD